MGALFVADLLQYSSIIDSVAMSLSQTSCIIDAWRCPGRERHLTAALREATPLWTDRTRGGRRSGSSAGRWPSTSSSAWRSFWTTGPTSKTTQSIRRPSAAQVLQHCLLLGLGLRAQVLKHCRLLPNKKYAPWWQDEALHQAKSLLLIASPKAERQSTKRAGGPAATPCASFPL